MKKIHGKRTKARRILFLFLFLLGTPTPISLSIGIPMVALGQLINLITYGVLTKRGDLVTAGPYAWCRNPFYLGTLLSDFGFCTICDPSRIPTLAVTLAYAAVQLTLYHLRILAEEKKLRERFGAEYEAYCARVRRRIVPSLLSAIRYGGFSMRWSAGLALNNRIFSRVASAAFWCVAFWAICILTGGGANCLISFVNPKFQAICKNAWLLAAAGGTIVIYAASRIAEHVHFREPNPETTPRI